ncbi:MAG: GNAT family N-acetyltransferase [[Actinobacillus] rossii]|nr:GNAT family N-acetyltransferase [[Actinobacillus] rossii]MDY5793154.1 GNAT family N-acetyltransferase [[Actinobacillus] rossii]
MRIFKAEQWNLALLLPLFEEYRLAHGMSENPDRTLAFLTNRIRFSESIFFVVVDENESAVGFIQLYPRLSSLQLQRYWQLTDIFVQDVKYQNEIYKALIEKAKEFVAFTQSTRLTVEQNIHQRHILESEGFRLNPKKAVFELNLSLE